MASRKVPIASSTMKDLRKSFSVQFYFFQQKESKIAFLYILLAIKGVGDSGASTVAPAAPLAALPNTARSLVTTLPGPEPRLSSPRSENLDYLPLSQQRHPPEVALPT